MLLATASQAAFDEIVERQDDHVIAHTDATVLAAPSQKLRLLLVRGCA